MRELTAQQLRAALHYDPDTGVFTRRSTGRVLGAKRGTWYVSIRVGGQSRSGHRLAWLYVYGAWPLNHIDHIDGDRLNNRIANLRDVPRAVNMQNMRGAAKNNFGATYNKRAKKWFSQIRVNGKNKPLGYFDTAEAASAAYIAAKRAFHEGCTI